MPRKLDARLRCDLVTVKEKVGPPTPVFFVSDRKHMYLAERVSVSDRKHWAIFEAF
jgi:hypothetical protein